MLKTIVFIVLLCTFCLGDDTNDTYIFKAKGDFAKELKQLMEKYENEGKVEVIKQNKEEAKPIYSKQPTMLDSFLNNEETTGDLKYGKALYEKTCYRCHGEKADKSSYPTSRILNTLSKKELYESLFSYKTDVNYGKSTKFLMYTQASQMTTSEMISVSAYIYSLTHTKEQSISPISEEEEKTEKKGVQGTYLK